MNINDFQTLDREAQLAEAGRIAGVEPSVFDGIWRTESGRGANMLSPAGAEGHFGLMPKTRKTMEQRLGAPIDPYNFSQSLYTAAHLVKENLGRFGNLPDALRAYNGGWDPKRWNNKETLAYAGKVLGTDEEEADAEVNASTAEALQSGAVARALSPAASLWDRPANGPTARKAPPVDLSPVAAAIAAAAAEREAKAPAEPDYSQFNAMVKANADAGIAKHNAAESTSFLDTMRAAAHSTLLNQTLVAVFKESHPADPNFVVPEEALKGRTENEQKDLRAARSQREFDRIMFDLDYDKEQNEITFRNGGLFGFGAALLADLPGAALTGAGTTVTLGRLGLGSMALAAEGRRAAAIGASTLEGVVGNVAYTGGLDLLGKRQSATDYALAVAGGVLNPILSGRAIGKAADRADEVAAALRIAENARTQQGLLLKQAQKNLGPNADGEALTKEMSRLEAEGIRADVTSHTATVPESRKFNVGHEEPEVAEVSASHKDADALFAEGHEQSWERSDWLLHRDHWAMNDQGWRDELFQRTGWTPEQLRGLDEGYHYTPALEERLKTDTKLSKSFDLAEQVAREYLPGPNRVVFGLASKESEYGAIVSFGDMHVITLNEASLMGRSDVAINHTLLHEIGHAVFHTHAPNVDPAIMGEVDKAWKQFVTDVKEGKNAAWNSRYAATNETRFRADGAGKNADAPYDISRDEWMAEQFVHHIHRRVQNGDLGELSAGAVQQLMNAVRAVLQYVKGVIEKGFAGRDVAADEFFSSILKAQAEFDGTKLPTNKGMRPPTGPAPAAAAKSTPATDATAIITNPIAMKYGLDMLPMGTTAERAEAKQILALYTRADAWAAANPIDEKRLNRILSRFDSFDPVSNQMLRSKNPVVRMTASELLENGGGAAGRRSSAAIAKYMNERAIIGNAINDLDASFQLWHKGQGGDRVGEFLTGRQRAEFNKLVAEEIEQRRYPGQQRDLGDNVRAAADAVEASFERARLMQIDAKTIGWAALPESSKGYMPHRMKADRVRAMTLAEKRAVHGALTDQFIEIEGFDMSFADQLASKYLDRVQQRALGGFDAPGGIHQTGAPDIVREALEQMGMNRKEVDERMARYMKGGMGHTKKRLSLDLRQQFTNDDGTTFRLLDLYDTDMLSLIRAQSQRVSGEVALARHGIMGKPGLAILRRAMGYGNVDTQATRTEVEAFDAAAAEFLGQPFGTQNKWVDRAMQANSVASLGGMGFNQLGEIINVATTLGVKKAFSAISSVGRLRAEVKQLARGKAVDNPWLNSVEKMGGAEFGTDAYKMVFPMDLPDAPINTMGADSLSAADRLLRGAGHLQSKLSMWRTIHSTQVRGVAEQIVQTFADALHKGKTDVTLADMGLSAEVLERLRADAGNILQRDGAGKLVGFDITKATDKDAAMQLVQAVHRGANQMIQGTFIGESGKYVHNSYLKMLAQFRSFSLTAIDKQWNRQKANRGVGAAFAMTVGAMGAAAPIYVTRTYLASIGREDQEEYLDKHLSYGAIARATTNYIATSGLAGDFLDVLTSVTGTGEATGGRSGTNTQLVGNLVAPVLGKVDKLWGAVQDTKDGTDVHGAARELPLSRLPFLIPAINALD